MATHYQHLSLFERQRIFEWFHYEKKKIREIARLLSRSHSTISRELKRYISVKYIPMYYPNPAHKAYKWRMRERAKRTHLKSPETKQYVIDKIKLGWTPELISGRLKLDNDIDYVCHESIYQYIYKQAPELREYLPRKHKKRRKKYPHRKYVTKISLKTSILDRHEDINDRLHLGHWESDSVESKGRQCALNVLLERVSRLTHITRLSSKKSVATKNAIIKRLSSHPNNFVKSITYDNGSENAEHLNINQSLNCQSFFCQPYHSWEKGAVEQVNGLIRRYLPKGSDFMKISDKVLHEIEYQLNSRPRKCLGYKTPFEVYNNFTGALPT